MGTLLQKVYDKFFIKTSDVDFSYKQDLVFEFFETAIGYSYKTTPHDLGYTLYSNNAVLIIYWMAENELMRDSGDITFNINSNAYTIHLLITDTKFDITNKIKSSLSLDYTVELMGDIGDPILVISDADSILVTFVDTDDIGLNLSISKTYDGIMNEDLDIDEIEFISLNMKRSYFEYLLKPSSRLKTSIGTKDFSKLPNRVEEYKIYSSMLKDLEAQIEDFKQDFYSYSN